MNKRKRKELLEKMAEFDNAAAEASGYVVYPPTGLSYDVRAAAKKQKELGRPLTDDEMKEFETHEEDKPILSSSKLPESVLTTERERIKKGVSPEVMTKAEKDFESLPEDMKQKFYRTFGK